MGAGTGRIAERLALVRNIIRVTPDPASAWKAFRFLVSARGLDRPGDPVGIRMRALHGEELYVRPGTSDLWNGIAYYSEDIYEPPPGVHDPDWIVELGTNVGVALAALGVEFPRARMLGVEADPANAAVARRNTARFGDRCVIADAIVWDESRELVLVESEQSGAHGTSVRPVEPGDPPDWNRIQGRSIDELLAGHLPADAEIGYMHVSIEGSERNVFASGGAWTERVRALRVEAHPYFGYETGNCIAQLEALGYSAWEAPVPPNKWVFAVRR